MTQVEEMRRDGGPLGSAVCVLERAAQHERQQFGIWPEEARALLAVLARAGQDTARLNWIEANRTGVVPVEGNIVAQGSWCIEPPDSKTEDDVFIMPTLRETIDYAMRCDAPARSGEEP